MKNKISSGQSFLAIVILIGGIVLLAAITLAIVTITFVNSSFGYQASEQSEAVAIAGAEDGLLQLARNSAFSSTSGYSIAVGSSTATVTVTQNSPSSGFATVLSVATVSLRIRKVQVVVSENPTTGQTSVVSWNEVQ